MKPRVKSLSVRVPVSLSAPVHVPLRAARYLFWSWLAIGLLLMLFYRVPEMLSFSNGLFNLFFASYAFVLLWQAARDTASSGKMLAGRAAAMDRGRGSVLIWVRIGLIGAVTFAAEWFGTATGFPFGHYAYTDVLRFGGSGVPMSIAFAWAGIVACAALISAVHTRAVRALYVGGMALWFDLVLDPVAAARQFWIWSDPLRWGSYYGIPLQNFASWLVLAMVMSLLLPRLEPNAAVRREALRLAQGMVLMFGALAGKEQLWWPMVMAGAALILLERSVRRDRSAQESTV